MRSVLTIAAKDLRLLVRDRFGLFWALVFPLVYAVFFGAVMGGINDGDAGPPPISVALVDEDRGSEARALAQRLIRSGALRVRETISVDARETPMTRDAARDLVRRAALAAYVRIPHGYSQGASPWGGGETPEIEIGVDPSRQAERGILQGLVMEAAYRGLQDLFTSPSSMQDAIVQGRASIADAEGMSPAQRTILTNLFGALDSLYATMAEDDAFAGEAQFAFEPATVRVEPVKRASGRAPRAFEVSFPQAVSWALIGCASGFAITLVQERTQGTFLRLLLSPQTPVRVLAGKALACLLAGVAVSTTLLAVGAVALGVRVASPLALALSILCMGVCFVGIMMFVSTLGRTPNSVAGASWGIMLFCAMLGGGMIPLFVMPQWMQSLAVISPVRWSIIAMEGAIWRDLSVAQLAPAWIVLLLVGAAGFSAGVAILKRAKA